MRTPLSAISASILLLTILAAVSPAMAGPFDGQPKILLHRTNVLAKNPCLAGGISDCSQAVTSGDLNAPGFVYVLVAKGNQPDLLSISFAIEYQDNCSGDVLDGKRVDIFSWNSCADAQLATPLPQWPAPRSGMFLSWAGATGCRTAPLTIGGYFYMSAYEPDTLQVTVNHPNPGFSASVLDCNIATTYLAQSDLGSVCFSSGGISAGCNPCDGPCAPPLPAQDPADCAAPPPPPPPPPPNYSPKLLLHVGDVVAKNPCGAGRIERCDQAVTAAGLSTPAGPFHYLYLMAAKGNLVDLAGLLVGIDYENGIASDISNGTGVDVFSWTHCATLEFLRTTANHWPAPGGSNLIVWDYVHACQTAETAVAGYFYVGAYSADRFRLVNDTLQDLAQVALCNSTPFDLERRDLGYVEFSDGAKARGCNPCLVDCSGAVTVMPTTWSRIKSLTTN